MQKALAALTVMFFALLGWLPILFTLSWIRGLPRFWFVLLHYALDVLVFGLVFSLYYKRVGHLSPFATMAVAMLSLFAIELVFWGIFYSGEMWFLNWIDWIVPAFLVASTVYLVGGVFP
jgi:hypothetical protein